MIMKKFLKISAATLLVTLSVYNFTLSEKKQTLFSGLTLDMPFALADQGSYYSKSKDVAHVSHAFMADNGTQYCQEVYDLETIYCNGMGSMDCYQQQYISNWDGFCVPWGTGE